MTLEIAQSEKQLTSYPIGSFREFLEISIPLILLLLSGSLMRFCDRLFLSHYSVEALEACMSALALCNLFQLSAVRLISIIQSFVGQYKGSGELQKIGRCVWQMIWISFILFVITLPLGLVAAHFYFKETSIASLGSAYFRTSLLMNLLVPLRMALSSFFVGQGKTRTVLYVTLWSHGVHFVLDPLLIYGIPGIFPSCGIQGAAVASVISQMVYCAILFYQFMQSKNRQLYGTDEYRFNRALCWECLKVGIPRALSRVIILANWAAMVRMLTIKGGNYLLAYSFGMSVFILQEFIIEGMGQAIVTIGAYMIGSRNFSLMRKLVSNVGIFTLFGLVVLAIPCVIFPDRLISFILPTVSDPESLRIMRYCCYWTLLFFVAQVLNCIGHNLLTAFRDTFFQMVYNAIANWVLSYGLIFYFVEIKQYSPDKIWIATSFGCLVATLIYSIRIRYVKDRFEAKKATSN